jgi:long-chain fatty acid transport protein
MGNRSVFLKGVLAAIILSAAFSGVAFATNGMQLIGIGVVQRSMGGAGSALPLDSFVITVNPASIGDLPAMFDLSVTYFDPSSDYESTDYATMSRVDVDESSSFKSSFIPALGVIYPLTDRFTLGLAAFGSAGMGVDYDTGVYRNSIYTSFEMMKVVPALSYKINDKLFVGVALNLDRAAMEYEAGGGVAHDKDARFGFGFQLGAYLKPSPQWSLSLAYISEEDFDDFEFDTPFGKDTMSMNLPQQVVFGVGYRPTDRLRLAFDMKWIDWTQTMGHNKPNMPIHEATPEYAMFDMDWGDQIVFALGVEYDLVPEQWKLRAGYNYGKTPLTEGRAFENIAFPALCEHHFTAGVGYSPMENLWVNLGGVYAPRVSITGSNMREQGISDYEASLSEYSVDLGISYRF